MNSKSIGVGLMAALVSATLPYTANAQCSQTSGGYSSLNKQVYDVRISTENADKLDGVTMDEYIEAAKLAMDLWNAQTNHVYVRFVGYTDVANADCVEGTSTILVDYPRVGIGAFRSRCDGTQWVIKASTGSDAAPVPWTTGSPKSGRLDLVSHFIHEFGHLGGMRDNYDDPRTIMARSSYYRNRYLRELYEQDMFCLVDNANADRRDLNGVARFVINGVVGSPRTFAQNTVSKAAAGKTRHDGVWAWSAAYVRDFTDSWVAWTEGYNTSLTERVSVHGDIAEEISSLTEVTFRDGSNLEDFIFYPSAFEDADGHRQVRYSRSNDGFVGHDASYRLFVCDSMSSSSTPQNPICNGTKPLHSGYAPSVAFDDGNDVTVVAWKNMDRTDPAKDGQLLIAFGEGNTFSEPQNVGAIHTAIPPAITCKAGEAIGARDCIVAYVDADTSDNRIRTAAFQVIAGSKTYEATRFYDGGTIENASFTRSTGSKIALFNQDGDFYLAYKAQTAGQPVKVLKNAFGGVGVYTWVKTLPFSVSGPSAVSNTSGGNNVIVTVEE